MSTMRAINLSVFSIAGNLRLGEWVQHNNGVFEIRGRWMGGF